MSENNQRVCVLISSYNGEKYIEAQIESVISQTYKNIDIFVRDDGSKDNTLRILKKFENMSNVKIYEGKNVGFINSFLDLLRMAPDYDYYSFCDQDDVWLENKIELAVKMLNQGDSIKPSLYFSSYEICDENLNPTGKSRMFSKQFTFQNAIVDCAPMGFVSVINKHARDLICDKKVEHCCGHDWYSYILCTSLGNVYFDKTVTAKYRRHGNNVSSGGASFIKFQIWRLKKFFFNDYFSNLKNQLVEFEGDFGSILPVEQRKLLLKFTRRKYSILNAFSKALSLNYYRHSITDEIFVRVLFLIGKL